MRSTVSLFILYALAVAAVGVPVEFTLGDGAVLSGHTLECSDFEVISDMTSTITTKEEVESSGEPVQITLSMIENEDMLTQLKRFWCEEVSEDIGPEQFSRFIRASNYLLMHGDTSMRFGRNMARAALLGRHSSAIARTFPYANPLDGWNITWQMFIALAAQTGCEARVSNVGGEVTLCSAGARGAEAYGTPASEFEKRPVIRKLTVKCGILGNTSDAGSQNAPDRMAILTWFLCHLGVPSLSIDSEFRLMLGDIQCLSRAISYIKDLESTGEIEKALILEELDLSEGPHLDSQAIRALIPSLPSSLKKLQINIDNSSFNLEAASVFKRCEGLEKLYLIQSPYLDSVTIEALIPNLPSSLKELLIDVGSLTPSAGHAFKGCDNLEKLQLGGAIQDAAFVSALVPNVPSLKELQINVESLTPSAGHAFKKCNNFEKLHLYGVDGQSSSFVSALIPNVPSLKELLINVESLTPSAGHAFKGCDNLEKLHLYGVDGQSSSFVSALIPNVPSLKELLINVESLSLEVADALKGCEGLEELHISGCLIPGFFKHLLCHPLTDSLKSLKVYNWRSQGGQDPSDEDNQAAIAAARERSIQINIWKQ